MSESSFYNLCHTLQQIRQTRGTSAKIRQCADYLQALRQAEDIRRAAQFIGEGAFPSNSGKRASVGGRTSGLAAASFCELDYDAVFKPTRTAVGSSSEAIEKLMAATPAGRSKRSPRPVSLSGMQQHFEELRTASNREEKIARLCHVWSRLHPVEVKYMIRMMGQGSLRIGFESRSLVQSIAKAFGSDPEAVRYAHMVTGSIGETAVMAFEHRLDDARFRLFHPLSFMLASPIDTDNPPDLRDYVAEEKFDGMRCQLHVDGETVRLFSRDRNDITPSFPDVTRFFTDLERKDVERSLNVAEREAAEREAEERKAAEQETLLQETPMPPPLMPNSPPTSVPTSPPPLSLLPPMVLDGELVVFKDERIQPFQMLQKRMGRKKPGARTLADYPVRFVAYDLLFFDGRPLFHEPLTVRRALLEDTAGKYGLMVSRQFELQTPAEGLGKGGAGSHQPDTKKKEKDGTSIDAGSGMNLDNASETSMAETRQPDNFPAETRPPDKSPPRHTLDQLFERALARGNEGLMLKKRTSIYEYGQRRNSWLKVKRPGGSLDTVMMYAHAGSGKRGGTYSDFTLGISVREDERFEEEFIPIGKAYGGYTDNELKVLNEEIRKLTVERYGPTLALRPGIVVELEFDDIQINKRTKAGYTLRFPRFRAIRWDLSPGDADTLRDVERLVEEKLSRQPLDQREGGSLLRFDLD